MTRRQETPHRTTHELPAGAIATAVTALVVLAALLWLKPWHTSPPKAQADIPLRVTLSKQPAPLTDASVVETAHYTITTAADHAQTAQVADAVEAFHAAYLRFFAEAIASRPIATKHRLTLYRDRQQFQRYNTHKRWAEAYYRKPNCYAYTDANDPNPYHWMIHEAAHQLNYELAGFRNPKWIEEGLGTYFGSSRIENGKLIPGKIDENAYPIWHLSVFETSGNLATDITNGDVVPLHALITGINSPSIDSNVNRFYIQYWSLTHFLLHGRSGRYAQAYKKLIADGGSLQQLERDIGPLANIEKEWYAYLQQQINDAKRRDNIETTITFE